MLKKLFKAKLSFLFLISASGYANENIDFTVYLNPQLAKPLMPSKSFADENEIVYIVDDGRGKLSAKLAKVNGVLTTGV